MLGAGRHLRLDDSDSDSEGDGGEAVLTSARASELCDVPHRLVARGQRFGRMEDLGALSALDYVDVTGSALRSLEGLSGLRGLKTLIARGNRLSSAAAAAALARLPALRVLNLAENDLTDLDWLARAEFAHILSALVVNGNRVCVLDGVAALAAVETLVVSHNDVEDLGVVRSLPRLRKLSASHNRLRKLPDDIGACAALVELRVAHNRISALPSAEVLARLARLQILDVGHNRLTSLDALRALAAALKQVNVAGNPASKESEQCRKDILAMCPALEVVDGTRIAGGRRKLRLARERKLAFADRQREHDVIAGSQRRAAGCEVETVTRKRHRVEAASPPRTCEKTQKVEEEPHEDIALDAEEFLAPVRKHRATRSKAADSSNERKRTPGSLSKQEDDGVGQGGDSAWA